MNKKQIYFKLLPAIFLIFSLILSVSGQVTVTNQMTSEVDDPVIQSPRVISEDVKSQQIKTDIITPDFTERGIISISSDADFSSEGFSGSGTSGDPYIIEDFNITGDGSAPTISIQDTRAHFEIKNNYLTEGTQGISLTNVTNADISGNNITQNANNGIYLTNANGTEISSNHLHLNDLNGIYMYASHGLTIVSNDLDTSSGSLYTGIYLRNSNASNIKDNEFSGFDNGIELSDSSKNDILDNYMININYGIHIYTDAKSDISSSRNLVKDNTISNADEYAIWIESRDNPSPTNRFNTISFNTLSYSTKGGLLVNGSNLNYINHNRFNTNWYKNDQGLAQVIDSGSSDNEYLYNYYTDHTSVDNNYDGFYDDPYTIEGTSGFEDAFPTTFEYPRPVKESINIEGDDDFSSQGFPGLGTEDSPYRIEDYHFKATSGPAISISNTDANFVIEDNYISGKAGIKLENVTDGVIQDNDIFHLNDQAIYFLNTTNVFVKENTINMSRYGLFIVQFSSNNTIFDNDIGQSKEEGIYLAYTDFNTIASNIISEGDKAGISLYYADYNGIMRNTIEGNEKPGVLLNSSAENNFIRANNFIDNFPSGATQAEDDGKNNEFLFNYFDEWTTPNADDDRHVDNPYSIMGAAGNSDDYPVEGEQIIHVGSPIIEGPLPKSYKEGDTGNQIIWLAADESPSYYQIFLDDDEIREGSWDNGMISINIDGLSPGDHDYELKLLDTDGFESTHNVNVEVNATSSSSSSSSSPPTTQSSMEDEGFFGALPFPVLPIVGTLAIFVMTYRKRR